MTTQRYVLDILQSHMLLLISGLSGAIFNRSVLAHTQQGFRRTAYTTFPPSLACSISLFVDDRKYLGSFRTVSWTAYEFGRSRGAFTAIVELNIAGHHA
ncbi:hypothetical protein TNCV_388991 [Trichonephila clavipes]|nr:hypothetical protein TNCV_388991 [Trichonephila clavipes]